MTDDQTRATIGTIEAFNDAFNAHDIDGILALMTDDCLFDDTRPAPDGTEVRGQEAMRAHWVAFFARSPQARFTTEELIATGDRCVTRWRYDWIRDDKAGHIRGIDLFLVRDGRVAEKRSYVKG